MLLKDHDLFIFDWDGTICTSTILVRLTRLFKIRYNPGYIRRHQDKFRIDTIEKLNQREQVSAAYSSLYTLYSMFASTRLKPNAAEILEKLKLRGKKVALFSDANRYRLFIDVKRLGVLDDFDFVLSGDAIRRFKPNPTGLIAIREKFRVPPNRTVYVGDMAVDIFSARFAKMHSCGVGDGVDPYELVKSADPDYMFRSMKELSMKL
ncbi:MAG: HAD-IA family hydrolase [Candidatus Micrarchaeota archaeon]|nr:HAD-IA family hydrolase [Candidatus Micrarchaeota archaeon]